MQQPIEQERRTVNTLSDEQIEEIAKRAAEIAIQHVYIEVGRSVIKKTFWLAGVVTVGLFIWLSGNGVIKP